MAVKETEKVVVDYARKKLSQFAKDSQYRLRIDKIPVSLRGAGGRPDLFVDIGPYHYRLEMKSSTGKPSELQKKYIQDDRYLHHARAHVIYGTSGVDSFVDALPLLNEAYNRKHDSARVEHQWR